MYDILSSFVPVIRNVAHWRTLRVLKDSVLGVKSVKVGPDRVKRVLVRLLVVPLACFGHIWSIHHSNVRHYLYLRSFISVFLLVDDIWRNVLEYKAVRNFPSYKTEIVEAKKYFLRTASGLWSMVYKKEETYLKKWTRTKRDTRLA